MADQAATTAPGPVAATTPAQAVAPTPPRNEQQGVEFFRRMLEPESKGPPETKQADSAETTRQAEPEKVEEEAESQATAEEAETSTDTGTEETTEDGEQESLPDTVRGLAEALGLKVEDLSSHVKMEIRTADGGTELITLGELARGHLREADYTAKTKEIAESKRQLAEKEKHLQTQVESRLNDLAVQAKTYESLIGEPPDPNVMLNPNSPGYDPDGFRLREANYNRVKQLIDSTKAQLKAEVDKHSADVAKANDDWLKDNWNKTVQRHPEFKDAAKRAEFGSKLKTFLESEYGYSPEEVQDYSRKVEYRQVQILKDAFAYRQLQKDKPVTMKVVKQAPQKLTVGTSKAEPKEKSVAKVRKDNLRALRTARPGNAKRDAAVRFFTPLLKG